MQNAAQSQRPAGKSMGSSALLLRVQLKGSHCLNQAIQEAECNIIPSGFVLNKIKPCDLLLVPVMQTLP